MSDQVEPSPLRQRVVRVFVSSTFKDMHAERDELAKRVFPRLRRMCEQRGIVWAVAELLAPNHRLRLGAVCCDTS